MASRSPFAARSPRGHTTGPGPVVRLSLGLLLLLGAAAVAGIWRLVRWLPGTAETTSAAPTAADVSGEASGAPSVDHATRSAAGAPTPAVEAAPAVTTANEPSVAPPEAPATPEASAAGSGTMGAVTALLAEMQPAAGGYTATLASTDRAGFARAAALDEVGKAAVEATVDRFTSVAEEASANFASANAETVDLLGAAYQRASEELRALVPGGGAGGGPTLSLGQQLSPELRQRLLPLSAWVRAQRSP